MRITSTLQFIIRSLEPSSATAPFDSCHGRVSGINKICFLCSSYCHSLATAHSGLGSNMGMGFHLMNDVHQCLENGEAFVLDFWICFKTVRVVCLLINCNG